MPGSTDRSRPDTRAYVVGLVQGWTDLPSIVEYLTRVDATLAPHGGRFIAHTTDITGMEGEAPESVVIVEFATPAAAQRWYSSEEYAAIRPLRTGHSDSTLFLVEGVTPSHRAADLLRGPGPTT